MNRKEWIEPNLLVLGLYDTKNQKSTRSSWICSCDENHKFGSIEDVISHLNDFWANKPNGTEHWTKKIS